ncbi:MAG TPA: HD domain-containing protein [Chloroflexota bacterium]
MPPAGVPGLGELAAAAGSLKEVRRKGWVDRGVSDAESVADHSYRVALLAWALARARGLDAGRAMLIGLVHDLAEAEVGDETPYDALLSGEQPFDRGHFDRLPPRDPARLAAKHARERAAIERLAAGLPADLAAELAAAWRDYDAQASPEARLVKQLDRVETLLQAEAYAARRPDLPIGSFRRQVAAMSLPDDLAALVKRVEG